MIWFQNNYWLRVVVEFCINYLTVKSKRHKVRVWAFYDLVANAKIPISSGRFPASALHKSILIIVHLYMSANPLNQFVKN